ncbi:LamG-like jellyroll fold domain-containing protein [Lysinibacillus cavernae]|uniref:LamG-like jellyroll fold domain-containing protein n=1 Tax=Lysinibacillus cavernae TaxID=2666135 RepID=UPI0012D8DB01|nr:LamG-like jellyroll fold domain-containing protein [Lysinibacillus cavernae]
METRAIKGGTIKYNVSTPSTNTVEFWIKLTNEFSQAFRLFSDNRSSTLAEIAIDGTGRIGARHAVNSYGNSGSVYYGNTKLEKNEAYHVAVTMGGNGCKIYVNGVVDYSSNAILAESRNVNKLTIGNSVIIEFPRYWNRQLTQDEIVESYKNKRKLISNISGLIMYDLFDEATGSKNEVTNTPTNASITYHSKKSILYDNKSFIYHEGLYKKYSNETLTGNVIPTLTDNNVSTDGIARASSELGGTTYYAYAYKAFNKTNAAYASSDIDAWHTSSGIVTNSWLSYEFKLPKTVVAYSLVPFNYAEGSARMPKSWVFQGSNNNTDWENLHTVNNSTGWGTTEKRTFTFSNNKAYTHYRIYIYSNNGNSTYIAIGELEMFEVEFAKGWTAISDTLPKPQQFLEKGMNNLSPLLDRKIETLEPIPMTQRNDILDVGEVGKVFSKTIELKKYLDIRSIRNEVK